MFFFSNLFNFYSGENYFTCFKVFAFWFMLSWMVLIANMSNVISLKIIWYVSIMKKIDYIAKRMQSTDGA